MSQPLCCHQGTALDGWMFDDGMAWTNIVQICAQRKIRNNFHKPLMVMDAFKANLMDDVAAAWF